MKAVIFTNPYGVDDKILQKITKKLAGAGIKTIPFDEGMSLAGIDFAVAFGGDGTILRAAKYAARFGVSVLGINGGKLGYTAGIETDELDLLRQLKTGEYRTDRRMMFEVVVQKGDKTEKHLCINDAVMSKGITSRPIDTSVRVSGKELFNTSSDGVIVATPTGSTAYSLSAGGPILDPAINSILVTTICPHSFFSRPVVMGEDEVVEIRVNPKENSRAFLTIDGDVSIEFFGGDTATISKSHQFSANLIWIKQESFMQILHRKFWGKTT